MLAIALLPLHRARSQIFSFDYFIYQLIIIVLSELESQRWTMCTAA